MASGSCLSLPCQSLTDNQTSRSNISQPFSLKKVRSDNPPPIPSHQLFADKAHTETAHPSDIFSLAVSPHYVISAAGDSNIKLWDAYSIDHPLVHTFEKAHPLGVHHITVSKDGRFAASAGFGGETTLWDLVGLQSVKKIASMPH